MTSHPVFDAFGQLYEFGLDGLTNSTLDYSLGIRVVVSLLVLAPLGLVLGMFMPLGLAQTHRISPGANSGSI